MTALDIYRDCSAIDERIERVRSGFIYNLGHGAEHSGEYLLGAMLAKQESRRAASEGERN